jgi:hypothetical protein
MDTFSHRFFNNMEPMKTLGDRAGNAPSGFPLLFGNFPKYLHYSLGVAEEIPKNCHWPYGEA